MKTYQLDVTLIKIRKLTEDRRNRLNAIGFEDMIIKKRYGWIHLRFSAEGKDIEQTFRMVSDLFWMEGFKELYLFDWHEIKSKK